MRVMALVLLGSFSWMLFASSPFKQSLAQKTNAYVKDGLFIGGSAGSGSSLLAVRRNFSKKANIERIIIDLGNKDAKPAGKNMSYYQASMDAQHNRVILDLAQLKLTLVSEQKLKQVFKDSPFVASVEFTLDPEDQAGTIVLNLKRPMQLEVFNLLSTPKPARIVMDLTPAKVSKIKDRF